MPVLVVVVPVVVVVADGVLATVGEPNVVVVISSSVADNMSVVTWFSNGVVMS